MKKKNESTFSVKHKTKGYELFLILYIVLVIVPSIILASGDKAWINIILAAGLIVLVLFYYFDNTYDTSVSWGMRAVLANTFSPVSLRLNTMSTGAIMNII